MGVFVLPFEDGHAPCVLDEVLRLACNSWRACLAIQKLANILDGCSSNLSCTQFSCTANHCRTHMLALACVLLDMRQLIVPN